MNCGHHHCHNIVCLLLEMAGGGATGCLWLAVLGGLGLMLWAVAQ